MIILNSAITTPITNHNLQLEALMSENSTKDQIQIQTCSVKQPFSMKAEWAETLLICTLLCMSLNMKPDARTKHLPLQMAQQYQTNLQDKVDTHGTSCRYNTSCDELKIRNEKKQFFVFGVVALMSSCKAHALAAGILLSYISTIFVTPLVFCLVAIKHQAAGTFLPSSMKKMADSGT